MKKHGISNLQVFTKFSNKCWKETRTEREFLFTVLERRVVTVKHKTIFVSFHPFKDTFFVNDMRECMWLGYLQILFIICINTVSSYLHTYTLYQCRFTGTVSVCGLEWPFKINVGMSLGSGERNVVYEKGCMVKLEYCAKQDINISK